MFFETLMSFLKEVKSWLGLDPDATTNEKDVSEANPLFVYVRIPADLDPLERGERSRNIGEAGAIIAHPPDEARSSALHGG